MDSQIPWFRVNSTRRSWLIRRDYPFSINTDVLQYVRNTRTMFFQIFVSLSDCVSTRNNHRHGNGFWPTATRRNRFNTSSRFLYPRMCAQIISIVPYHWLVNEERTGWDRHLRLRVFGLRRWDNFWQLNIDEWFFVVVRDGKFLRRFVRWIDFISHN